MAALGANLFQRWTARREPETFRELAERHAGRVYATCLRILRNDADAQDITQACFELLIQETKSGPIRDLGPWLHGVAVRKCLMHLRSEGRRREREAAYAEEQPMSETPVWNDIYACVDEGIQTLPEELRGPIVSHFLYGESHAAIARSNGMPRRTVSHRIEKGLALLGEFLRQRGIMTTAAGLTAAFAAMPASAAPAPLAKGLGQLALSEAAKMAPSAALAATAWLPAKIILGVLLAVTGAVCMAWWTTQPAAETPTLTTTPPSHVAILSDRSDPTDPSDQVSVPAPAREGTWISGTAREAETGNPAEGVTVKVYNEKTDQITERTTDAKGEYTMPMSPNVDLMFIINANREGWRAIAPEGFRLQENEQRSAVDILLQRNAGAISGTVYGIHRTWHPERIRSVWPMLSGASQQGEKAFASLSTEEVTPLPKVHVLLAHPGDKVPPDLAEDEVVTDAEGHYRFESVPPGRFLVFAAASEDAVQYREDRSPSGQQKIDLGPEESKEGLDLRLEMDGVTLLGRVTDTSGQAVPGAVVTAGPFKVERHDGINDDYDTISTKSVTSVADAEGRYHIRGLCPANWRETGGYLLSGGLPYDGRTYLVKAQAPGFAPAYVLVPALQHDTVEFMREFMKVMASHPQASEDTKDRDPAKVVLPTAPGNVITGVDFVIEPAASISGRVIDTLGKALAKTRVLLQAETPAKQATFRQTPNFPFDGVETTEDGAFVIGGIPSGIYVFVVNAGRGDQRARNATLGVVSGVSYENVEVVVESEEERGTIEGLVVTGGGRPVANFQGGPTKIESPNESSPRMGETTLDQARGSFRIDGISAGLVTLEFKAEGYANETVQVEVQAGHTTEVRVDMEPEGILRGRVTRNGEPSAYGGVWFAEQPDIGAQPNDNGEYEIKALAAGTHLVNFTLWLYEDERGGAQVHERRWFDIQAGQECNGNLDYRGDAAITGRFEGLEGTDWSVQLVDQSMPGEKKLRASTWKFKKNGQYELFDLPPGTYTVEGICSEKDGTEDKKTKTITLSAGETATVDFIWP